MNGTCSGTHIIYQCGYGLEAGVQTPSSCLPFTDLGSLISISRFLLFRKWIAQQGSRKAPEKKISRQECQQKYDHAEAGCPVDVTVHVRSCQASEQRGNYREQNVSKESNEPPLSLDVPSLFANSVFQLVCYAGSLEAGLLDIAFVLANELFRPVNTAFQIQDLALVRTDLTSEHIQVPARIVVTHETPHTPTHNHCD
jgi:hypothetical protein